MAYFLLFLIGFLGLAFFFSRRIFEKRKLTSGAGLPDIKQLIGGLYEFYSPDNGETPNVEVMFFHGLQQHGDASRAHADTWISSDGSNSFYWPQKLLAADFPSARIFSISYDSSTTKSRTSGRMDRYLVAENLLQDLTHRLGHRTRCPVILVGKDVGGLVIKKMCLLAANNRSTNREKYQSFLRDIWGILYYCTPHRGVIRCPSKSDGAMLENLGLLDVDLARLSEEFNQLNTSTFKWRTRAIIGTEVEELCIPEGSFRDGAELYYTVSHKLHSVGRPRDTADRTYSSLTELISDAISEPSTSNEFELSLLFTFDKNYVPMTNTLQDIQKAFETTHVVVLYGDSGTGKSSLARYYALCFENDHRRSSSSPVVSYVSCGSEAVVFDIQVELLRTFNFKYFKTEFEVFGLEESQSQKMARLHTTFVNHLRGLDALVILDDVWKASSNFLDKILVQGKNLRYLITTRDADLWPDSESIKIEDVTTDYGRQILANYAKFEGRCIPEQLQVEADELIQDVQAHPLALATLGAVLQYGDKSNVHHWRNVREDLLAYMKTDRYRSVNCGESYPRSVSAALMLVVDDKFLDADTMILLLAINLFQGPSISESLVQTFLRYTRPAVLKFWTAKIRVLQALSLVQVQKRTPSIAIDTANYAMNKRPQDTRVFFIHGLRQTFILQQKKEDMDKITGFLHGDREFYSHEKRSDDDWATVLCAISGVSTVRNKAQQKMGSFYRWVPNYRTKDPDSQIYLEAAVPLQLATVLENSLALLPVSTDEHNFNEHSNSFTTSSNEVLWTFLIRRQIDYYRIANLIQEKISIKWACSFLINVFGSILAIELPIRESKAQMAIQVCSNTLIAVLAQDVDVATTNYDKVLLSLCGLVCHIKEHVKLDLHVLGDQQKCVLDTTKLLRVLTGDKFWAKDMGARCKLSMLLITGVIDTGCCPCKIAVVRTPGFMDKVIEFLGEDVAKSVQEVILYTLCKIASSSGLVDENGMIIATVNSNLLLRIVLFLSPDLGRTYEVSIILTSILAESHSWAVAIVNSPGYLQKLIDLLAIDIPADQQEPALQALCYIASHPSLREEIFVTIGSDLLLRIIPFLSQDLGTRCRYSVKLIGHLTTVPNCAKFIINSTGCLERLTELLAEDVAVVQQKVALATIGNIISHSALLDENGMIFTRIGSNLLLRIVSFLSPHLGRRYELSAILTSLLAKSHSQAIAIVNCPGYLQKLIDLLAIDIPADQQEPALQALCYIASHPSLREEIFVTIGSDLLLRIIPFLSQDLGTRCRYSVKLIGHLTTVPNCAKFIINSTGCLERLIELLAEDVAVVQQEFALATIGNIISHSALLDENGMIFTRIGSNLLLRIVSFLSPHLGRRYELSAILTSLLAKSHSQAIAIVNCPGYLQKLIDLLAIDIPADQQEPALQALCCIASHPSLLDEKIFVTIGSDLLLRIIPFLSQDLGTRYRYSVKLIGLLLTVPNCATFIINSASCLERLTELLAEDVAVVQQEVALATICKIIISHSALLDENGMIFTRIGSNLLLRIVSFLLPHLGMRYELSTLLTSLLAKSHSWAVAIVNSPGYLQKLIDLLAIDIPADQQEPALQALCYIASHPSLREEIFVTIGSDLLLRIIPFLSQDLGTRCRYSVKLIGHLTTVPNCAKFIINSTGCLERLTELLAEDVAVVQQEVALATICDIISHSALLDENGMIFTRIGFNLLLRIVPFLSKDLGIRGELAIALISNLARAKSCRVVIINFPNCLKKLVELLAEGVAANLQEMALTTLGQLASHDVDVDAIIRDTFGMDVTNLERHSVRHVIEKQINNMQNVNSNIHLALYRCWYYEDAMQEAYPHAISNISKALKLDPKNGFLWQERGILCRLTGEYLAALGDLDRALEIDIDDYDCLKHRALVKFLMSDKDGACVDAERAILVKPTRVNDDSYGCNPCLGVRSVQFMHYKLK